jgi:mevalonate kinase
MSISHFFSHAKLLLTGEYLVLLGARAFALPLRFGQSITLDERSNNGLLYWKALEYDKNWFSALIQVRDLSVIESSDLQVVNRLIKILRAAREINAHFLENSLGYIVTTNLNFKREWGLGTSSTLISNIAWWANIDPFALHWKVSRGSGYDIACSRETQPLIYSLEGHHPVINRMIYAPPFIEHIYFVYLGKKQDTARSIQRIEWNKEKYADEIARISQITEIFATTPDIKTAIDLMEEHEQIISEIIRQTPVKAGLFPDFPGTMKSLGAWGGDFVMVLSGMPKQQVYDYFMKRGLETIFMLKEMI